jgi:pilus assembly protein CpaE
VSVIVLASASAGLQDRLAQATDGRCVPLPPGPFPTSPAALLAQLDLAVSPDVVVLDSGRDPTSALELAGQLHQQCPGISVVVVSDLSGQIGLDAIRAGVRDILDPESEVSVIRSVLERACARAAARALEPEPVLPPAAPSSGSTAGRVISVVSPKGGVGKTMLATNLAVGLASTSGHLTVLVDLDLQFGDVASALNLQPEHSLPDTLQGPASRDSMVLKTFLALHETGLYVICGPKSPAEADSITAQQVSHLLQMLASEFHYVVVDTETGLSDHVLAAMDASTDLVLVSSMDVAGLRGLRKELDVLTEMRMLNDSRCVVLNFVNPRDGLSTASAQAASGTAIDVLLPRSKATPRSLDQGVPLLQSGTRDPMTKQLRALVARFIPAPVGLVTPVRVGVAASRTPVVKAAPVARPRRAASRWARMRGTVA